MINNTLTDTSASSGRQRTVDIILVLAIFLLALFLRWRYLDTTGIWGDQSFTLNTAMRWVNGGDMPLAANKSSVGFVNPPMIEYLYAAALRLWPDVLSVALLTMASGMVALAAAGWAAWRLFGRRAALWTLLLMAVNPWSVYYSQLIWNQTMLPLFTALTLAFLLVYFAVEPRPRYLILSFVTAACMTQVHPGSVIQLAAMGLVFLLFWRKLRIWPLLAGIGLFILLYVPFILYQFGVGWGDLREAVELAGQPATTSIASILISLDLLQAKGLMSGVWGTAVFDTLAAILLTLSLLYAGVVVVVSWRRPETKLQFRRRIGLVILLIWFALPVLFYLRTPYYLQIYYLLGQLPAHFLLMGFALAGLQDDLARMAAKWSPPVKRMGQFAGQWLLPLPFIALVVWQFAFNLQFQNDRWHKDRLQIRHVRTTIQTVNQVLAENSSCQLVAVSEGHQLEISRLSFLREFTIGERVILVDGRYALPFPQPCAIYLDALTGSPASSWLSANAVRLPETKIRIGEEVWPFYVLSPADWERIQADLFGGEEIAGWEMGVALTGYGRGPLQPGDSLPVQLAWSVKAPPPRETIHVGLYLLTMDNQVVAQYDGPGYDSLQWRQGDNFITWFELPIPTALPSDEYQLAVALYTWPDLLRLNLTTGDNTAFLEQIK